MAGSTAIDDRYMKDLLMNRNMYDYYDNRYTAPPPNSSVYITQVNKPSREYAIISELSALLDRICRQLRLSYSFYQDYELGYKCFSLVIRCEICGWQTQKKVDLERFARFIDDDALLVDVIQSIERQIRSDVVEHYAEKHTGPNEYIQQPVKLPKSKFEDKIKEILEL